MSTPVIIPAFNEERHLTATLESLPKDGIRPIVAANASTDRTVEIAEEFGAEVIERSEQGKLPVIQETLRMLGKDALNPLIILDADTKPIFPHIWHQAMLRTLHPELGIPSAVGGPVIFTGENMASASIRTMRRMRRSVQNHRGIGPNKRFPASGPQIGMFIQNDEMLEMILDLPHYWPGEDHAVIETLTKNGGTYVASVNPQLLASTPTSESYVGILDGYRMGLQKSREASRRAYVDRGAMGSMPFDSL